MALVLADLEVGRPFLEGGDIHTSGWEGFGGRTAQFLLEEMSNVVISGCHVFSFGGICDGVPGVSLVHLRLTEGFLYPAIFGDELVSPLGIVNFREPQVDFRLARNLDAPTVFHLERRGRSRQYILVNPFFEVVQIEVT
jgi:hypothetical protein